MTNLRATVLTNRAMVLFKQGKVSFAYLAHGRYHPSRNELPLPLRLRLSRQAGGLGL